MVNRITIRITISILFLYPGKMNFSGDKNSKRLLLYLLNTKPNCSYQNYVVHHFFFFLTKHPMCRTSLRLNRCLIKVKRKTLQVCLSQLCDHSQLLIIVLYFQVITINPYQLELHLLATGSFTDRHFQEHHGSNCEPCQSVKSHFGMRILL